MQRVRLGLFCILLVCLLILGCTGSIDEQEGEEPTPAPTLKTQQVAIELGEDHLGAATPTPYLTPSPVPEPSYASIGAVGDIMITSGMITAAVTETGYDFSSVFAPMQPLFSNVDVMCANLETVLGGQDAGYTKGTGTGIQTFSAPDELVQNLKDVGFSVLTTANNHCMDREKEGAFRTIEVLRAHGLTQTGTYLSYEDRKPCIVECNGIKIGIIATTAMINNRADYISTEEERTLVCKLFNGDKNITAELQTDIKNLRDGGAEFIIVFAHWGEEYVDAPSKEIKKYAEDLLTLGADAILGSHPHVVQPFEYVSVQRGDGEYTGLVAYSLGNFLANESDTATYGMFVKLTLKKDYQGDVTLYDAAYLPTCIFRSETNAYEIHPVLASRTTSTLFLDEIEKIDKQMQLAQKHLDKICGNEVVAIMEDYVK